MEQSEFVVKKMANDMRFVGIFTIIYGAFSCLSIIGAIVGVPLIIAGLRLRESADAFVLWLTNKEEDKLNQGFDLQAKYFFIQKIIIIVTLILMVLSFVIMFASIGFLATEFQDFSQAL